MTAEEYIQSESTTFESPNIDSTSKIVETFIAKKAIEMARKEEREKAIEAFKELQCYCGKDMDCYFCSCRCNLSKFRKIINQ